MLAAIQTWLPDSLLAIAVQRTMLSQIMVIGFLATLITVRIRRKGYRHALARLSFSKTVRSSLIITAAGSLAAADLILFSRRMITGRCPSTELFLVSLSTKFTEASSRPKSRSRKEQLTIPLLEPMLQAVLK